MERPTVLLALDRDAAGYAAALERAGFDTIRDAGDVSVHVAAGGTLDLAVLEWDAGRDEEMRHLYALLHEGRETPTLILFSGEPPDLGRAQSSADELALSPLPVDALAFRLQALQIRAARQRRDTDQSGGWEPETEDAHIGEGRVVSVFAPKGGVGKTTVAVNVAVALREQTRDRILLLDADVGVGNVTSVLEVPASRGLVDLADSGPEEWTDEAFEQIVATHPASGLRVMTWGREPGDSERIGVDLLIAAQRWGRRHHAYVIIDNHPGYDDRTMAMLTVSNETLLVVTPEVGAIRNSAQFLELARQVGLGDTVRVIVNRANHGIRLEDMAQSLGLPVAATIVSNGPKAVVAANEGMPVITKFPKERIATDLHNVARVVTRQQQPAPAPSRRWRLPFASRASNA